MEKDRRHSPRIAPAERRREERAHCPKHSSVSISCFELAPIVLYLIFFYADVAIGPAEDGSRPQRKDNARSVHFSFDAGAFRFSRQSEIHCSAENHRRRLANNIADLGARYVSLQYKSGRIRPITN